MPRILFVSTSTTVGGAEKTVFTLATLLEPNEFPVAAVVSLKPAGAYAQRLRAAGVKVRSLDMTGRPGLKQVRELAAIIDEEKPDIVHAVMYQAIQLCRLAKGRAKTRFRLISSPRVSYRTRSRLTLCIDRRLKGADDLLIAECDSSRRFLTGRQGYAAERTRVIYNGVDVAHWPRSPQDRKRLRAEIGAADDEALIGSVGRLDVQKGHSILIEAAARLPKDARFKCVILGQGPRRPLLEALARRHRLEARVRLLGERDDLAAWLSAFDVFVLPSLWEGLPNALLEAMAFGLPVVASAVDGAAEAVQDGANGLLAKPGDPSALARRIGELLAKPDLRERLGAAARRAVGERFTLVRMMDAYQQAYRDVVSLEKPA